MTYARNPNILRQILPQLQPLLEGRVAVWQRPVEADPRKWAAAWAYKVRQGLSIAERHPQHFGTLAALAPIIRVQVLDKDRVQAGFIAAITPQAVEPVETDSRAREIDFEYEDPQEIGINFAGLYDFLAAFPKQEKYHFVRSSLTNDERERLARSMAAKGWMVLYDPTSTGLTLAPDDPEVPASAKVSSASA